MMADHTVCFVNISQVAAWQDSQWEIPQKLTQKTQVDSVQVAKCRLKFQNSALYTENSV